MKFRAGTRSRSEGYTLIETLIVAFLVTVVFGLVAVSIRGFLSYRKTVASRTRLQQYETALTTSMIEDVANAGKGLKNAEGNRLVVTEAKTGKAQPAAFLESDGKTLTIVTTAREGVGETLVSSSPGTLVVAGVEFAKWQPLQVGSLVFCVNRTGPPALYEIRSVPRRATASDIGGSEFLKVNLNRTAVVSVVAASACAGVGPATTTQAATARVVPVTRIVRYRVENEGVVREEVTTCGSRSATSGTTDSRIPMTPGMTVSARFEYVSGPSISPRPDPNALQGIQFKGTITDSQTRLTQEVLFNAYVTEWK